MQTSEKAFEKILYDIRSKSLTESEKGTSFEKLTQFFLQHDAVYSSQFEKIQFYSEWAEENGHNAQDTGIDLVATFKPTQGEGFCAIQCKMYAEDTIIQKNHIDSFFTASGKTYFTQRYIVDTTEKDWSENVEKDLKDQRIPTQRITLDDFKKSTIPWEENWEKQTLIKPKKKFLRPHQKQALEKVENGFKEADRGKLIMACGTGKTFTSLKIAEKIAGTSKNVLYLVPSLSLMSQTIREWNIDKEIELRCYSVCSDSQVGKKKGDDIAEITSTDLAFPAHTNAKQLAEHIKKQDDKSMTVVFATYHSLQVISDAQNEYDMQSFDLVICDEAHRTTGVFGEEESNFVKIHEEKHIKAKKRLYMTATPRIYASEMKEKAKEEEITLASMDDENYFGKVFETINFGYAVKNDLLTDYKVIILAMDESIVDKDFQDLMLDEDGVELNIEDAAKLIGCYKALCKLDTQDFKNKEPMRRSVSFCRTIEASKKIKSEFPKIVKKYKQDDKRALTNISLRHVDGSFNAKKRNKELSWLKEEPEENECRVLTNARCLSEGVDVPSLDSVIFIHPRNSQVDIVQAVGRVMRKSPGKEMGYVIIPVAISASKEPDEALNNNKRYKVIWEVLNALRAHDERLDAEINRGELGGDISDKIEIVAVANSIKDSSVKKNKDSINIGKGTSNDNEDVKENIKEQIKDNSQLNLWNKKLHEALIAKIVKKCGNRLYWDNWSEDVANIAQTLIKRIGIMLEEEETEQRLAFDNFLKEIQDDLNSSIGIDDAIEMLAQHIITKPIFETLFSGSEFTKRNAVSKAMENIIFQLEKSASLLKETKDLEGFYESIKLRASGLKTIEEKQKLIVNLYDNFFKKAFPRTAQKLGIVYTPVEVVDFIIHSIDYILQKEFNKTLGSKGVNILDPFTGTGTFITRLLQSGLIKSEELEYKYKEEIHANEIVLLAYYIASVNIEQVYHQLRKEKEENIEYTPFQGICLTDTFNMDEKDEFISKILEDNNERIEKQKNLDITVLMGNPPYSVGQKGANDNNQNVKYPKLDSRIEETYVKNTTAQLSRNLYDSYVKAIRWGSDKIKESGVMGFVTNSSFIDSKSTDGLRKCLKEEFSSLYIFDLRGDINKNIATGKGKEGENIFGQNSKTGVATCFLIKKKFNKEKSEKSITMI